MIQTLRDGTLDGEAAPRTGQGVGGWTAGHARTALFDQRHHEALDAGVVRDHLLYRFRAEVADPPATIIPPRRARW
jgi:hypothetical protein